MPTYLFYNFELNRGAKYEHDRPCQELSFQSRKRGLGSTSKSHVWTLCPIRSSLKDLTLRLSILLQHREDRLLRVRVQGS